MKNVHVIIQNKNECAGNETINMTTDCRLVVNGNRDKCHHVKRTRVLKSKQQARPRTCWGGGSEGAPSPTCFEAAASPHRDTIFIYNSSEPSERVTSSDPLWTTTTSRTPYSWILLRPWCSSSASCLAVIHWLVY